MFIYPKKATLYRKILEKKIHTVVGGDTLNGIAIKYETTSSAIMLENNMSTSAIYIGQKLTIPAKPGVYLKDDYGRFKLEPIEVNVAIDLKQNIVKDQDGAEVSTFMDVDFPPDVLYGYGDELEYIDPFNRSFRGEVKSIEENTDPFGIRILSRFSQIG
jgi:LysM repeat protein